MCHLPLSPFKILQTGASTQGHETDLRPEMPKLPSQVHSIYMLTTGLSHFERFERCVLLHSGGYQAKSVSEICLWEYCAWVSHTTIWASPVLILFHKMYGGHDIPPPEAGHLHADVPGRLGCPWARPLICASSRDSYPDRTDFFGAVIVHCCIRTEQCPPGPLNAQMVQIHLLVCRTWPTHTPHWGHPVIMFEQGHSISTLKVYLAANVGCNGVTPGAHPLGRCFIKGARHLRHPALCQFHYRT